ncbi:hypothetical protein [Haloferax denitrificans]|uniref:Uncharacterized protein n=1 Tax=Haloferax denitrificans ATCC 35960 TaxID=662478 RepID=M0JFJ4_9EURY|nr:hypothetical protein [Haloferax denitrificans]EMA06450.1 hypothetical protein C438_07052 [Haloferax denitrificans ATCC 35960]
MSETTIYRDRRGDESETPVVELVRISGTARESSEQFTESKRRRLRLSGRPVTVKYLPSNFHGEQL